MTNDTNIETKSEEINLKAEISRYTRNWYWFALGVLICLFLAFLYLRYTTPLYQTSVELLVKDDKKGGGGAADAMAMFQDIDIFNTTKSVDNEVRVLKSKSLLKRALKQLPGLQPAQFVVGNIRTSETYGAKTPLLVKVDTLYTDSLLKESDGKLEFSLNKNKNSFKLKNIDDQVQQFTFGQLITQSFGRFRIYPLLDYKDLENANIILQFRNLDDFTDNYSQKLNIAASDKQTSTIIISVTDAVPKRAEDIINKLIEVYNQDAVNDKNITSRNTIQFIDERLRTLVD
ncbi:MAG TPA: Wzz/FepE/Etk N-terminal domain-containing protein, partial [Niabella sp.]